MRKFNTSSPAWMLPSTRTSEIRCRSGIVGINRFLPKKISEGFPKEPRLLCDHFPVHERGRNSRFQGKVASLIDFLPIRINR